MQNTGNANDIRKFIELYDTLLIPSYRAEIETWREMDQYQTLCDHLDVLIMDYPLMRQWFVRKIMLIEERERLARIG